MLVILTITGKLRDAFCFSIFSGIFTNKAV